MTRDSKTVVIIGAGPSGLALAYELIKKKSNYVPIIIEKLDCPGGLSRTVYDGELGVDIGGHRLFTKNQYIQSIWNEFLTVQNAPSIDDIYCERNIKYPILGKDPNKYDDVMLIRKRYSSIIHNNMSFQYPIKLNLDTFSNLGYKTSFLAVLSYVKALFFKRKEKNLEDFMINRFGKVLYDVFFKSYTKKVWGVDASVLSSEWGHQRIRKLSLFKTVINAFLSCFKFLKFQKEASLIDEFYYPKYGCSALWNKMADYIVQNGGQIIYNSEFLEFSHNQNNILSIKYKKSGKTEEIFANYFVSSIPVSDLIKGVDAPYDIKQIALALPYRDYILVSFYTNDFYLKNKTEFKTVNNITPECWIYLQEKDAIASRIQIMNNWSPYLVGDFRKYYLVSLEYFANEHDELWDMSDDKIKKLAANECQKYNLFSPANIIKSSVIREKKAYPSYFGSYFNIKYVFEYLKRYKNLFFIGRNGTHQYNNMDEAMVCGINIAREIMNR